MQEDISRSLKDIYRLIDIDINKLRLDSFGINKSINQKFLNSFRDFCNQWLDQSTLSAENIIIIPDITEKRKRKFFIYGFKSNFEKHLVKDLKSQCSSEWNPIVAKKLIEYSEPSNFKTLQKRVSRYFFHKNDGYQARLK